MTHHRVGFFVVVPNQPQTTLFHLNWSEELLSKIVSFCPKNQNIKFGCINYLIIIKLWFHFSKIHMKNNWFVIWYSCSCLVAFATIETKSNKRKKKINNTQSIMKKKIEGYLHFILSKWYLHSGVGMKYVYLYHTIFKFINTHSMIKSLHYSYCLFILPIK